MEANVGLQEKFAQGVDAQLNIIYVEIVVKKLIGKFMPQTIMMNNYKTKMGFNDIRLIITTFYDIYKAASSQ